MPADGDSDCTLRRMSMSHVHMAEERKEERKEGKKEGRKEGKGAVRLFVY